MNTSSSADRAREDGDMRQVTLWAFLLGAAGCGGGDGLDLGVADPSATRPGPVDRPGAPRRAPGTPADAPYAAGDRVDLGGADVVLVGPDFTQAGVTVAMPGDMDGDGFAEIAVSNSGWRHESGGVRHAVNLVYGSADLEAERILDRAETTLITPLFEFFGGDQPWLAPAGDVDGDGLADLLVGLAGSHGDVGRAYLVYGDAVRRTGEQRLEDVAVELTDGVAGGRFGARLTGVGDMNADGRGDFAIVAFGADSAPEAARIHLSADPLRRRETT